MKKDNFTVLNKILKNYKKHFLFLIKLKNLQIVYILIFNLYINL